MNAVIINFESKGLEGEVAVGSYLIDAAKRLGVRIEGDCADPETGHDCVMRVGKGRTLLSPPTRIETQQLTSQARKKGDRLACQTKIDKPGEITIMSVKEKKEKPKAEEKSEGYKKEFEALPLEKKIASLMELEAIALGETFSYVLNSPYKAVGKVMDVMAEFGFKLEREDQEAKRPDEHKEPDLRSAKPRKPAARKTSTRKKGRAKPAAKKPVSKSAETDNDDGTDS